MLLPFLFFIKDIQAQEAPVIEAKIYETADTLFVQKQLPIYISISTGTNKKKILLKSTQNPKDASPMYFDTEGENFIRSRWAIDPVTKQYTLPRREILLPVYADGLTPTTKIIFDKADAMKRTNGMLVHNTPLHVTFKSTDGLSGVDATYFSINGSAYEAVAMNDVKLEDENKYIIKYRATDKVGNLEDVNEVAVVLDYTPPVSSHKIEGRHIGNILSGTARILLSLSHPETTNHYEQRGEIQFAIDTATEKKYIDDNSILMRSLAEGDHELSYAAIDFVNNREKTNRFDFFVDKSAPETNISYDNYHVAGSTIFVSGETEFRLDAFDNKAGVEMIYYAVNNESFKAYNDTPFQLDAFNGKTQIKYYAIDKVGNSSEKDSGLKIEFNVDKNSPILTEKIIEGNYYVLRDTTFINPYTKVGVVASDGNGSGINKIEYLLDDTNGKLDPTDFNLLKPYPNTGVDNRNLVEGDHNLHFYATDNVGNIGDLRVPFFMDRKGPEIQESFGVKAIGSRIDKAGNSILVYPKPVVVFLHATDDYVGYKEMYYQINDSKERLYGLPLKNFKAGMDYKIKVRAIDNLENETTKSFSFGIDE